MTRRSRPTEQPLGHGQVYQGVRAGHDYRYQPGTGTDQASRRGESCTVRRIVSIDRPGTVWVVVEFADGEKVSVEWSALLGLRERLRKC